METDPEGNAPRIKQSTQWLTIERHNRTHAKLSSLRSVCFVRRLVVLLPNFVIVIEHIKSLWNHPFWPSNITDIDRDGWNITCRWCQDSYISPWDNIFPQCCALRENITPWENITLLAVHRNVIFHDRPGQYLYIICNFNLLKAILEYTRAGFYGKCMFAWRYLIYIWYENTIQFYLMLFLKDKLFNIVEAWFKKLLNFDGCVVWWCSDGPINSQECKSFEIYAVTIKIFMTEYHHWINGQAHLFQHSSLRGEMKKTYPVTCLFSLLWST